MIRTAMTLMMVKRWSIVINDERAAIDYSDTGICSPAPNVDSPLYVTYKKPSSSLCSLYTCDINAAVGGNVLLFTNTKIAFSGCNLMRLRITYTNWPTYWVITNTKAWQEGYGEWYEMMIKSHTVKSDGTKYFFLSISGISLFGAFSAITYWYTNHNTTYHNNTTHESAELTNTETAFYGVHTGMRSGYLARMRPASAFRFSIPTIYTIISTMMGNDGQW